MCLVSVIIAAWNPERYLVETINSVIGQTFRDWELLVVDDGSHFEITRLIPQHPRITLVRQENKGLSAARNVGISRTNGEFLAFLDHDDVWMPRKLELQVEVLRQNPDVAFCYTDFERIDGAGNRIGDGFEGGAETYHDLLKGCCICVSTTLVRRTAIAEAGLFDPLYVGTQDYDMWLKLARWHPVRFMPTPLAQYRQHGNNVSRRYAELWLENRHLFQRHLSLAINGGDARAAQVIRQAVRRSRRVFGSQAYDHGRRAWEAGEFGGCFGHLWRASLLSPGFVAAAMTSHLRRIPGKIVTGRRRSRTDAAGIGAT